MPGYPLVDVRAMGRRPFTGTPVPLTIGRPKASGRAIPFLGRRAEGALSAARADLAAAEEYLNRVEGMYPDLAALVGESKAMQAVGQARASVGRARDAYGSALEITEAGGGP